MPTYEYRCQSCNHQFEAFQQMRDEPLKVCPQCNAESLKRLIGKGGAVIFKGTGFYQTDYKNPSKGSSDAQTYQKRENPYCGSEVMD